MGWIKQADLDWMQVMWVGSSWPTFSSGLDYVTCFKNGSDIVVQLIKTLPDLIHFNWIQPVFRSYMWAWTGVGAGFGTGSLWAQTWNPTWGLRAPAICTWRSLMSILYRKYQ